MVSNKAVATAITLIGSVSFVVSLYYLTHYNDADIRKYTYIVLCETIALFCSVLFFNSIDDVIKSMFLHDDPSSFLVIFVDLVHFLFWHVTLQVSLAYLSGSTGSVDIEKFNQADIMTKHDIIEKVERNMKGFVVVVAHITGFASVHLWSTIQQAPFIGNSLVLMYSIVPIALILVFALNTLTNEVRFRIMMSDEVETVFEREWDIHTTAAEDNVLGLTLSFTFTQALRFTISGILPSPEGLEPLETLKDIGTGNALHLMLVSCLFITLAFLGSRRLPKFISAQNARMDALLESDAIYASQTHAKKKSRALVYIHIITQAARTAVVTLCMGFGWCMFFSTRWFLAGLDAFRITVTESGKEITVPDLEILSIVTALILSFGAILALFVLDKLADSDMTDEYVDKAIAQTITAIGILIGFAWDQCFLESAAVVASRSINPHVCRIVLALMSAALVTPAWKWYLIPMAHQKGCLFGFVPGVANVRAAREFLDMKVNSIEKFDVQKKEQQLVESVVPIGNIVRDPQELWVAGEGVSPVAYQSCQLPRLEKILADNEELRAQVERTQAENASITTHYKDLLSRMSNMVSRLNTTSETS